MPKTRKQRGGVTFRRRRPSAKKGVRRTTIHIGSPRRRITPAPSRSRSRSRSRSNSNIRAECESLHNAVVAPEHYTNNVQRQQEIADRAHRRMINLGC